MAQGATHILTARRAKIKPVSYTHLDVYKRQGPVPLDDVRDQLFDEALTAAREEHYGALLDEWVAAINPVYHYDAWEPLV